MLLTNKLSLYLGRDIPNAGRVEHWQLMEFLELTVNDMLQCYTLSHVSGFWNGQEEETAVITVMCNDYDLPEMRKSVKAVGMSYKHLYNQEAVLYTEEKVNGEML